VNRLEWIAKFIKVWGRHPTAKELKYEAPKDKSGDTAGTEKRL
jgi:hypothetical protein